MELLNLADNIYRAMTDLQKDEFELYFFIRIFFNLIAYFLFS